MTAIASWERRVGTISELVVAADSRLSGGERWDACAKVFSAGNSSAFIAFAGETERALPLILQVISSVTSYRGSELRTLDVAKLSGHLRNIMNEVLSHARGPAAADPPRCEFLLGGWSWLYGKFRLYKYKFDRSGDQFRCFPVTWTPKSLGRATAAPFYATIGDGGRAVTSWLAAERRGNKRPLELEPLEALHQVTRDDMHDSVGGPVQVAKVYRNMRVEHFAVEVDGLSSIAGRPQLGYERTERLAGPSEGWHLESGQRRRSIALRLLDLPGRMAPPLARTIDIVRRSPSEEREGAQPPLAVTPMGETRFI